MVNFLKPITYGSLALLAIGSFSLSVQTALAEVRNEFRQILAQDGSASDLLGGSVAIYGNTAIVGASGDSSNGFLSGSAYIFDVTTGTQITKLLPDDGSSGDRFGLTVAIHKNIAIVGARFDGPGVGTAYLFDATNGTQIAKLIASDGAAGENFGSSVSIDGNLAIVAAELDDDNGPLSGSAYIFDITTGSQIAKILPQDGLKSDFFGRSVGISSGTAIVGAPNDDDNGGASGSVYLFDALANSQTAKLLPSDGAPNDRFGSSVAISGNTAIIGAPRDDDMGSNSGSAYLFDISTGEQIGKLLADDGSDGNFFGSYVSISGNFAVVGAPKDDDFGYRSGSAYLFDITTGKQIAKLLARNGLADDVFGLEVGISGNKIIAGAYGNDDNGSRAGSSYLFLVPEPSSQLLLFLGAVSILVPSRIWL